MDEGITVAELREALNGLPDDTPVRIESQVPGRSESIGFMYLDPGGWLRLVLADLCCGHVR
jgi:hypothetical protein